MRNGTRPLGVLIALALAIVACGPGPVTTTPPPSASGPAKLALTDKSLGEIQAVMQAQHDALVKRDLKAYQATYDLQRPALRRCRQEEFDVAGRAGTPPAAQRVIKVTGYGDTYALAWVEEGSFGVARYYFRQVDGKWVQTEPLEEELGGAKTTTMNGVEIDYWGIDGDVVEALGRGSVAARDAVAKSQLSDSKDPFRIRFYPTRALAGLQGCRVVGYHVTNAQQDKTIRFLRYWFTADLKDLNSYSVANIQHEGLHGVQDQFSPGITARLEWWMVEGWPDYVGQSRSAATIKATVCGTPTPTLRQLADGPREDLPETLPEDVSRYYAFANSMVEYLYAQLGGLNTYKQLLTAYKAGVDAKVNYPLVFKMTPDEFYSGWLAFAKKKYC